MKDRVMLPYNVHLIGDAHKRGWITPRTAADFKALIEAHLREHPAEPLRLDIHESEGEALQAALVGLRCDWAYSKHADAIREEAGFGRFIFWAPAGWALPKDRRGRFRAYYTADEITDVAASTCYDYRLWMPQAEAARERADEKARGHLQLAMALAAWVRWSLKHADANLQRLDGDEARLFALLITPTGRTADGRDKYMPIREIAKRLEVSPAMVEKRVKRLRKIKSVSAWLDRNAPRKARGRRWGGVQT